MDATALPTTDEIACGLASAPESSAPARARGGRPARGYTARGNIKLSCACGFACRVTALALEQYGAPACACGRGALELANFRDIAALYPERALSELESVGPAIRAELVRELRAAGMDGLSGLAPSKARRERGDRKGGADQRRCQYAGGYCSRYAGAGGFCAEHRSSSGAELTPAHRGIR